MTGRCKEDIKKIRKNWPFEYKPPLPNTKIKKSSKKMKKGK